MYYSTKQGQQCTINTEQGSVMKHKAVSLVSKLLDVPSVAKMHHQSFETHITL